MRIKQVEVEGQQFSISPLSVEQVEQLGEIDSKDPKAAREAAYLTVVNGLNNAQPIVVDAGTTLQVWDRDRVRKELDWPTFNKLQEEILDFTGLRREPTVPKGDGAGEALAARIN